MSVANCKALNQIGGQYRSLKSEVYITLYDRVETELGRWVITYWYVRPIAIWQIYVWQIFILSVFGKIL